MTTSLYIPFLNLTINNEEGLLTLYESIVQSGPAYKLIVHDSPEWIEIKERLSRPEMIEILPEKKAGEYAHVAGDFLAPLWSSLGITRGRIETGTLELFNLTKLSRYKQILAYLLIAHDYRARILSDCVLDCYEPLFPEPNQRAHYGPRVRTKGYRKRLEEIEKHISEDERHRVNFLEKLIWGYKQDEIPTLTVNKDPRIFNDLMDLLDKDEVKMLSNENSRFSLARARKGILKRDIRVIITDIVKNDWFPYLVGGLTLSICYSAPLKDIEVVMSFLAGVGAKVLSKYDFRDFAPAFQSAHLLQLARAPVSVRGESRVSFTYKGFLEGEVRASAFYGYG